MNWLRFVIIAYAAVILQTAAVPVLFPQYARPHLMIALLVYYLLTSPDDYVLIPAIVFGVLADLSSLSPLGTQTVAFAVMAWLVRAARPALFTDLPLAHVAAAFAALLIMTTTYRLLSLVATDALPLPTGLGATLGQAAATALAAGILCKIGTRRVKPAW